MNGQWMGTYTGTNSGMVALEIDDVGNEYAGLAFAHDNVRSPAMVGEFHMPKGLKKASLRMQLAPVDRHSGDYISPETFKKSFPDVRPPTYADTEWEIIAPNEVTLKWMTDVNTYGDATLAKSRAGEASELKPIPEIDTWAKFKEFATALDPYRFLFRGHDNSIWKLRTSFHRTGRAALIRFISQDLTALHRQLSGLTTHRFDLGDPLDHAAFLNLVQHHGYPTPLLDWTTSPFIAAYFAFRSLRRAAISADQKVRVFIFNGWEWNAEWERSSILNPPFRHLTLLEPLAINNPRAVPQQSVSTVTNLDDIEAHIKGCELRKGKVYLRAIDLPASERRSVMAELAIMGINAGSLFPGLDGACDQLRERFFDL